ncbi:hypothetical protein P608_16225 [Comamonas thiooxydans]|jgi:hypothetical protein|uniref:Uncharacterized protein n=1 Tax=Comamonas thiooxydans TaxID=363952 RepID=A0A096EJW4_9BURK|nr:hypothetical protein P369_14435 [Comamonas thiooxydans]KGG97457.1 hypothetical protein P367_15930 [Comamonas thiooxydans]KGH01280.1 hypothetical protein P365_20390 [Comamonas thiooxydans]KGH09925.1 hypothetical protein P608_16225 [Comamonas thiooxydans]KGH10355.1 hypothetical protein P368_16135 [Comamonas thiooxydans]
MGGSLDQGEMIVLSANLDDVPDPQLLMDKA